MFPWKGSLQNDSITLSFENNNKGKIIFESFNNEYQLSSSFNKAHHTFVGGS